MYKIAVWGDDIFTPGLEADLRTAVFDMIESKPAVTFWFTDDGPFAQMCLKVIADIKQVSTQKISAILIREEDAPGFDRVIAPRAIPLEMPGSWPYKAFTYKKALKWTIDQSQALLCNFNPAVCRRDCQELRRVERSGVYVENVSEMAVAARIEKLMHKLAAGHQYIFDAVNHGRTYKELAEEFEVTIERVQSFDRRAIQRMRDFLHADLQKQP